MSEFVNRIPIDQINSSGNNLILKESLNKGFFFLLNSCGCPDLSFYLITVFIFFASSEMLKQLMNTCSCTSLSLSCHSTTSTICCLTSKYEFSCFSDDPGVAFFFTNA